LLLSARDSLAAADVLLSSGYPGYAASRAYYSMFYVAEAFLEGKELAFSKHSAVIAAFGREFARTGVVPKELHRFLIEAQELRHEGDYGSRHGVSIEQSNTVLDHARKFLDTAERLIGSLPKSETSEGNDDIADRHS
jgi:uncharacterized protein (UPF0332 family)